MIISIKTLIATELRFTRHASRTRVLRRPSAKFRSYERMREKEGALKAFKYTSILPRSLSCRHEIKYCKGPEWKPDSLWLRDAMAKKQLTGRRWNTRWFGLGGTVNERLKEAFGTLCPSTFFSFTLARCVQSIKMRTRTRVHWPKIAITALYSFRFRNADSFSTLGQRWSIDREVSNVRVHWTRNRSLQSRSNLIWVTVYSCNIETLFPFGVPKYLKVTSWSALTLYEVVLVTSTAGGSQRGYLDRTNRRRLPLVNSALSLQWEDKQKLIII